MWKAMVLAGGVVALAGCGAYFDQHPANVRPESEAVAAVLAAKPPTGGGRTAAITVAPAPPAQADADLRISPAPPPPARTAPPTLAAANSVPPEASLPRAALPSAERRTSVVRKPQPPGPRVGESPAKPVATPRAVLPTSAPAPARAASAHSQLSVPEIVQVPMAASRTVPVDETVHPPATETVSISRDTSATTRGAPVPVPAPTVPAAEPQTEPAPPPSSIAMQPAPERPAAAEAAPAPPVPDAHCDAVAKQRADDAAASGLDRDTQEVVRRGTYANCLAWDAAHPMSR